MHLPRPAADPAPPRWIRAAGGVRIALGTTARGTAPMAIAERGGYRVRFVGAGGRCEGVYLNTGGGLAGGDDLALDVSLAPGAAATLTTQAAEKVYRAQGDATTMRVALDLGPGAALDWLPQEQILFDGARLHRRIDVAMAADARLLLVESAVFGRLAMGETVETGTLRDRWRIRRGGHLVFAEDLRLEGGVADILARPACGGGARALATVLLVSADAEARVEEARAALAEARVECAAGGVGGMLVARFLSPDPQRLRAGLARFLARLSGRPLPRSWST
ncbi:urease accessory protein UreD [Salinarimonas chemoclinalis]|uniref:urease accessory protein UreD n=1 Tax=Salinarimonas chemoclinalis TaxID=3241599 RepID=UPI003558EE43